MIRNPRRHRRSARVAILERAEHPLARLLVKLGPGDAYSDPWRDLAVYGPVETERFLLGFYYVSSVTKPQHS